MSPRGSFFGRTSLGPEDVSPEVPHDSPRLAENRQSTEEQRADEILAKLGMILVRDPAGHVLRVSSRQPLKSGWSIVGPAGPQSEDDLDAPIEFYDHAAGAMATTTRRAELAKQLDGQAHEIRPDRYYTGKRVYEDGHGFIWQTTDDYSMDVKHGDRVNPFEEKK